MLATIQTSIKHNFQINSLLKVYLNKVPRQKVITQIHACIENLSTHDPCEMRDYMIRSAEKMKDDPMAFAVDFEVFSVNYF